MTDPIQQTPPQDQWTQQWQQQNPQQVDAVQEPHIQELSPEKSEQHQWYADDILGWEDMFASIPEAEEELPYGDVLEKKYQFAPIPETEEEIHSTEPVISTPPVVWSVAPAPIQEDISAPIQAKDTEEAIPEKGVQVTVQQPVSSEEQSVDIASDNVFQTDVQKKFGELYVTTKKIYEFKEKLGISEDTFDILWADNDKVFISYRFLLDETNEPMIFITKIEQDKETEEEAINELRFTFNQETSSLEVMVNDTLLFDEIQDFTEDPKKKMQVSEKLNKFIFLASEEQRKLEKEIKEKEEEVKEKRKLQDIFRNF